MSSELVIENFKRACSLHLEDPQLLEKLALIRKYFFSREYMSIFGNPELVPIYSTAYGPSKALAFLSILESFPILSRSVKNPKGSVLALGAGSGSELAALLCHVGLEVKAADIHIQDISDNTHLLSRFETGNQNVEFSMGNVLDHENDDLDKNISEATLISCCFLLNELLAESKRNFVLFVARLIQRMKSGTLLLVVDCASSFSSVGVSERVYMAYDLLDGVEKLEKIVGENSKWFRLARKLEYTHGIKLQNTRYFIRIYRRK